MQRYDGPQLRQLPASELDALLDRRAEQQARPRQTARDVLAKWLDNAGVGLGVAGGAALLTWLVKAPADVIIEASIALGGLSFAGLMIWRGTIDEAERALSNRRVRQTVAQMRSTYDEHLQRLQGQLERAFDEIEELERTIGQVSHERDIALLDLAHAREQAQDTRRTAFVPSEAATPQDESDAREMIHYRYVVGKHISRSVATGDKRWTQERHATAQGLLVRAGVVRLNGNQPVYVCRDETEALSKLAAYLLAARSKLPPKIPHNDVGYVEYEDEP